jgi:Mrp family chromosome partitioning ATPase
VGEGQIITFYSYKGGTGRSMALANVAWILALNGNRVLTVEWDLEAPGLHRYFLPFLEDPELADTNGLIDLFGSYVDLVLKPRDSWPPGIEDALAFANAQRHAVPLEFPFPGQNACLHFLGAGRQESAYATRVRTFDWTAFYGRLGGRDFIEKLRERFRAQYDYVLVDSRTGAADTSGICTVQIPDSVVLCYTYNWQSMLGVAAVAASIRAQRKESVRLLPVAMRVERKIEGYTEAKAFAKELLEQLDKASFESYWAAGEVPHYPHYSFDAGCLQGLTGRA